MFAKELVKFPIKEYLNTVIKKFNFINIDTKDFEMLWRKRSLQTLLAKKIFYEKSNF